jgi:uncharacterized repeat protein (TIGR01451 family)
MNRKILFLSATLFSFSLNAFAKPEIKIDLLSKKVVMEKGKEVLKEAKEVKPGDVILYTLKINNKGDSSAKKLQPVGNIPDKTIYLPEKDPSKDYKILYSVDGNTYSEEPTIKVTEKGKEVVKKAPIEKYKKIKWVFLKEFQAKKTFELNYKVKVR